MTLDSMHEALYVCSDSDLPLPQYASSVHNNDQTAPVGTHNFGIVFLKSLQS